MGDPDIDLDYDDLLAVNTGLAVFIDEFQNVESTTDELKESVGRPHGRTELRSKIEDFEHGWNGNREVILEGLQKIHDHITGVIDGFTQTDHDMTPDTQVDTPAPSGAPTPN